VLSAIAVATLLLPEEASFFIGDLRLAVARAIFVVIAPLVVWRGIERVTEVDYRFVWSDFWVVLAAIRGLILAHPRPREDHRQASNRQVNTSAARIPMIRFIATSVLAPFVGLGVYTASVSQTDAQAVCKFAANAAYDDGCAATPTASGALSTSSHQFPTVLNSYGANRPPFNVAGVDYPVGLPAGADLIDPSKGPWPAGCKWGGHTLSCTGSHVSIKGFDFSGVQLRINGGSGVVVTGNKFGLTSTCIDATLDFHLAAGAKMTVAYNDFEVGTVRISV
jgi:hypothetical protein